MQIDFMLELPEQFVLLLRPVKSLVNNASSTELGLGCSSRSVHGFDEKTTDEEFKGLFSNQKSYIYSEG